MRTEGSFIYKALLFSAALIWGSSFFMVKDAAAAIPVNMLLSIRFFTGAVILSIAFRRKLKENLSWDIVIRGCVMGFLLFMGYFLQTVGICFTTPGKNAFLTAAYCVIVPFLFWAVSKVRPDIYNVIASALLVAGIGFVSLSGIGTAGVNIGDMFTLASAFFYAAHIVAVARFSRGRDIFVLTIFQFVMAGTISLLLSLFIEKPPSLAIWSPLMLAEVAYLAVACTAVALLFQNVGQKHVHPAVASILLSLESVFGVLFSVIFYGEQVTMQLAIGFSLIFVAVLVSETKLSFIPFLHRGDRTGRVLDGSVSGEIPRVLPGEAGLVSIDEDDEGA